MPKAYLKDSSNQTSPEKSFTTFKAYQNDTSSSQTPLMTSSTMSKAYQIDSSINQTSPLTSLTMSKAYQNNSSSNQTSVSFTTSSTYQNNSFSNQASSEASFTTSEAYQNHPFSSQTSPEARFVTSEAYQNHSSLSQISPYSTEQFISYRIVLPVIIVIGVVCNLICIIILMKPKMRRVAANWYFSLLVVCDLMVCLMNIPVATTINGCLINSYADAFYFGHLCWSFIEMLQPLSYYTLLFLSFDRFLAVWKIQYFREHNKKRVFWVRVMIMFTLDILLHIVFFTNVEISCKDEKEKPPCKPQEYVIHDFFRLNNGILWHKALTTFHGIVVRWLPGLSLALFNIGLIRAIVKGKLSNPDLPNNSDKRMEFNLTLTLITMIFSTMIFTFPEAVYIAGFASLNPGKCYGDHELFRGIANIFQLLEHATSIVYLTMLNPNFRKQLKNWIIKPISNEEYELSNELDDFHE